MMKEAFYENFTTNERVNLVIAALARGDDVEIAALRRTCPRKTYTTLDREFTGKLDALLWVFVLFQEIYNFYSKQTSLCNACIASFMLMVDRPEYLSQAPEKKIEEARRALVMHEMHLLSLFEALSRFCSETGFNYEHILSWLKISFPDLTNSNEQQNLISEMDEVFINDTKNMFVEIWRTSL